MSETNERETLIGDVHILIRPPSEEGGQGEWEVASSFDNTALYWVLGKVQKMLMNDELSPEPQ